MTQMVVDQFLKSWTFTRGLTFDFIEGVPEDKWEFTPHVDFAPLCVQFRHMIWVTGLYRETMELGDMKACSSKRSHYSGDLTRRSIFQGLIEQDEQLKNVVGSFRDKGLEAVNIRAFDTDMGFVEFSNVLIEHEANHHGMWSLYARLGNFSSPGSWKNSWGM